MGLFRKKKTEIRAEPGATSFDDALLKALFSSGEVTKDIALQIPTVSGAIDLISGIVASTPIKLYRENGESVEEVVGDERVFLLNDEPGDTLNAHEFWRAMVRDYFLGKGAYAYINKVRGRVKSLHFVPEEYISINKNTDPIFKDFDITVNGRSYKPFDFFRVLRNTKDGASGTPITEEIEKMLETAYETMVFESNTVKKGGSRRGFLQAEKTIDRTAMAELRNAFSRFYQNNNSESVMVLNKGLEFKEASTTSTEMQLNENKVTNAGELAKVFHISTNLMSGRATEDDIASFARLAVIPLMTSIQCALNRDLLLEKEKKELYWAFDTKELLKGDMKTRFDAYQTALEANFMQIDEVRFLEDLPALGLNWIKLGLQDVLYDPETKLLYTPNTGKVDAMEARELEGSQGNLKGGDGDEN